MFQRISASVLLVFLFGSLGCASLDIEKARELASETSKELLLNAALGLHSKYQAEVGVAYLDKVAQEPLQPLQEILEDINQKAQEDEVPLESPVELSDSEKGEVQAIIDDAETNWLNENGWLRLNNPVSASDKGYDNENPLLFTAEYLWLVSRLGFLTGELREKWKGRIMAGITQMQLQAGLYDRYPIVNRPADVRTFSHDEQLGIMVFDHLFNGELGFAKDQYLYGKSHNYLYLNAAWSAPNEFNRPIVRDGQVVPVTKEIPRAQRFGAFVEVLRRNSKEAPSLASDVIICAGTVLSLKKDCNDVGDHLMNYLTVSLLKNQTSALNGCFYYYKSAASERLEEGKECIGREVKSENAYGAFTEFYFIHEDHPTRRLAQYLPEGAM